MRYVPQSRNYPLRIGAGANENPTGNYWFHCAIADVRVYCRLLSSDDVATMYTGKSKPWP